MKHLYPDADIPVIEMSLDYKKRRNIIMNWRKSCLTLRKKGVLIIGSGNMVHNLRIGGVG